MRTRAARSVLPLGWCIGDLPDGGAWLNPRRLGVDDACDLRVLVEGHGVLVQAGVSKPSDVCLDGERWLARELADEDVVAARIGGGPCVGAGFWGLDVDREGTRHGATGAHAAEGGDGWGGAALRLWRSKREMRGGTERELQISSLCDCCDQMPTQ